MVDRVNRPLPRAYWRLVAAHGISNIGDGVFLVALPLLAARLTRDPVAISLIAMAQVLPWLIVSLPAGAIIDRSDRRRVMIIANVVRAGALGVLCAAIVADVAAVWMLWVLAIVVGTAEVFYDHSAAGLLPDLVPTEQLERANGRLWSVEYASNTFIGTPIGSLLFTTAAVLPFGVDGISFIVAALLILTIRGSFRHASATPTGPSSLTAEVREGLRWLWAHQLLRAMALSLALTNLAFQIPTAVFVLFAQDVLGIGERTYGLLFAVMGVGSVLGGLIGDRVVARLGKAGTIYVALGVWVLTLLAVGIYPSTWFVAIVLAIESFVVTVWNVVSGTLRQQAVPAHLFGRVSSASRWIAWGTLPIGSIIGGQIAARVGFRANYFVAAAVMVAALIVASTQVSRANIDRAIADNREPTPSADPTPTSLPRPDDHLLE
ncbi:MAG: MFS transporter [Ilumatobacteraceae bacterium]